MMSRLLISLWLCGASVAVAKPWQGIEPGVSKKADVVAKFGEPSKSLDSRGKAVLVYEEKTAIKNTVQVQFKLAPGTGVVERIDVYPLVILSADAIEKSYGTSCDAEEPTVTCYVKKETERGGLYYLYNKLGLAVFFKDDNNTVQELAFLPGKK